MKYIQISLITAVQVSFCRTDKSIYLTFYDNGKRYNPLATESPDTSLSAKDRDEGGLGIYIVKKTASRIDYPNKDGYNILTIVFE